MCFVFRYFLASFPLFFIFCSSLHSPIAGTLPLSLAPRRAKAFACDNVSTKKTTTIGYHKSVKLSSEKCRMENRNWKRQHFPSAVAQLEHRPKLGNQNRKLENLEPGKRAREPCQFPFLFSSFHFRFFPNWGFRPPPRSRPPRESACPVQWAPLLSRAPSQSPHEST